MSIKNTVTLSTCAWLLSGCGTAASSAPHAGAAPATGATSAAATSARARRERVADSTAVQSSSGSPRLFSSGTPYSRSTASISAARAPSARFTVRFQSVSL